MKWAEWQDAAACQGTDPALWFGLGDDVDPRRVSGWAAAQEKARVLRAKDICQDCPVRDMCLDYALSSPEAYGIWGGFTREERRELHLGRPARGSANMVR